MNFSTGVFVYRVGHTLNPPPLNFEQIKISKRALGMLLSPKEVNFDAIEISQFEKKKQWLRGWWWC